MAETTLASASERQVWVTNYFQEYVRNTRFMPYMTNADKNKGGIILTKFEEQDGNKRVINVPFIGRLKGAGVSGAQTLDGMEEELTNYNMPITLDWRRNAVRVPKSTSFRTEIDIWNAAKDALRVWESEKIRDDIIKAMFSLVTDTSGTVVNYDVATAANKNTWTAANTDRVLFGRLISNYNATFATAVGNVASTATCSAGMMGTAKRMAKNADPHIRPYQVKDGDGREWYVAFHGSRTFRDLSADATIVAANTSARARENDAMKDNPLFADGDLIYNGVIHREVPEIDAYAVACGMGSTGSNGIGTAACDVRPIFLCGGGAVGIAWGQEPTPRTDMIKDYGFRPGVAIEELLGVKKINFNGLQNGMVTIFAGAAADS